MANFLFSRILELKDKNNAFSEGIFPKFDGELQPLPMEQTFATAEFLHTCLFYGFYRFDKLKSEKMKIEEKENSFVIENLLEVSKEKYDIKIKNRKFDILFSHPYKTKSRLYTKLSNFLRKFGLLNVLRDSGYVFKGVEPSSQRKCFEESIKSYIEKYKVRKTENGLTIEINLPYHEIRISVFKQTKVKMDLLISVKYHDLVCNKVIINGKDHTLDTNWTNGGLFRKTISL